MCSHYEAPAGEKLQTIFGGGQQLEIKLDLWPGYIGPFVRNVQGEEGELEKEVMAGVFGLLPHWAKDKKLARNTYNAKSETVAQKPSFRSAWKKAQHCIIPAVAIYEPDWRSGKPISTRITRTDGGLMAIAGLYESWRGDDGELVNSYTMLTISADKHPLMENFHRPTKAKRMITILPNGLIEDWLNAPAEQSNEFLRQYPADRLQAEVVGD